MFLSILSVISYWCLCPLHQPGDVSALCFLAGWSRAQLHEAHITLDPDTAHPTLILSENRKQMTRGDKRLNLPDTQRFDVEPCVLGCEGFTSGKHCWEVDVGDNNICLLGVCWENVKRKGSLSLSPENGFWAVQKGKYAFWTYSSSTFLSLVPHPCRVVVYLDYEAGDVSFYSATDGSHLYTFSHVAFSGTLRPFFWLWMSDPTPLTICPMSTGSEGDPVPAHDSSQEIPETP
ncbi:butyrophilin subfamily 1 member A1-like [Ornithorhynchus anatinus]|uniref:butyrophilin subfamily 1 member A1-like n=1 Tax=Ornithorhynchus anatinus TaxID=9258 RepID=UPI0010A80489|nr:butyrophilin subfamily 1 member A1-like [Ornithorhynchus anatinus]